MRISGIKKHLKLYLIILFELLIILLMAARSFGPVESLEFMPGDFSDNIQERADHISTDDDKVRITYSSEAAVCDDEGKPIGETLMTRKFALGSGAYKVTAHYHSDNAGSVIELISESKITDAVSEEMLLEDTSDTASQMLYVPFGRSMHDIQLGIRYFGPGELELYSITLMEDPSYRWVPVAGYALLFTFLDFIAFILFAASGKRMREFLREHYEITVLVSIFVFSSLPAFADILYIGHDMKFHLARTIALSKEIGYGQFPVRMLTDMLRGYSYPTSTFYCNFFLYPFAALYHFGLPLRMTWQIYILSVNLATTLISYLSFNRISGSRDISLIGTALYVLSAYRIIDVFLRSAVGEFTAMTFIPVVLLGMWLLYYSNNPRKSDWKYLAAGMTGIALCHLLTLEVLSIFLFLFCIFEYKKTFTVSRLTSIITAAFATVLMSCYFLFPMFISMRNISLSMFDHQFYIQAQGAYPSQVFNPLMNGYGMSTIGTPDEMPLSLGGGIIAAFALLIYACLKTRKDSHTRKILLALTLISLVFSMYFFPWDSLASIFEGRMDSLSRLARMVQYPWRFLEISTIVLCISAIMELKLIENPKIKQLWIVILIAGTVLSAGNFYYQFISKADWTRGVSEYYTDSSIGGEEYLSSGAGRLSSLPLTVETSPEDAVTSVSYESAGGKRYLTVDTLTSDTKITIPVFAYPGYQAHSIDPDENIEIYSGENARITLDLPKGYNGNIEISYKEPVLWRVFELISLISMIAFAAYCSLYSSSPSIG